MGKKTALTQDPQHKNPNVKLAVNEKYVSVSVPNTPSGLMERQVYKDLKPRVEKLSPLHRTLLDQIDAYERLNGSRFLKDTPHPLAQLDEAARKDFYEELSELGIADIEAAKAVSRDLREEGVGFKTPVYNVNGRSVMGFLFDDNGALHNHSLAGNPQATQPKWFQQPSPKPVELPKPKGR